MGQHPSHRRYPPELRERAVRMAQELIDEQGGQRFGVVTRVARELGVGTESLRGWLKQAEIDAGRRQGTSTADKERIAQLEREVRELRRAKSRCWRSPLPPTTTPRPDDRQRAERDAELRPKLRALWERNYSVYGRRKLTKAARKAGLDVGRDQVARLMRAEGIRGASRSKRRFTTHSDPAAVRAPDLLRRDFSATRPNHKWVADFTYCSTWSGVVYVAFVIDVFSRRIVGWKASRSMTAALVVDALNMAAWVRRGVELDGLICHSDAGSQGGLKWSSQHLDMEVVRHHVQARASGGSPRDAGEGLVAGAAVDGAARAPDRLLEGDRTRVVERGRCGRGRHGIRVRGPVVPGGWRHAASQAGRALGPLPVLRGT
jgi:putative transposase